MNDLSLTEVKLFITSQKKYNSTPLCDLMETYRYRHVWGLVPISFISGHSAVSLL